MLAAVVRDDPRAWALKEAEFYRNGFQAGNVATIVERTGVTKDAPYHHFGDEVTLGYAVLDEVIREPMLDAYLGPLEGTDGDPLAVLQDALRRLR